MASVSQILSLSARGVQLGSRAMCSSKPLLTSTVFQQIARSQIPPASCLAAPARFYHSSGWGTGNPQQPTRQGHSNPTPAVQTELTDEQKQDFIQKNLGDFRRPTFKDVSKPEEVEHFSRPHDVSIQDDDDDKTPIMGAVAMPHPIWTEKEVQEVKITHQRPVGFIDNFAFYGVQVTRKFFDAISGFNKNVRTERIWVNRLCFLETVAAVPGMVAAMVRHLHSLRRMNRDHGWIHTLLEEAENERMHLMTFLQLKDPSYSFRVVVMITQGVFVSGFSVAYLLSPKLCHRFVGYLEEEAVITYTKLLKDMQIGNMKHWTTQPAPKVAKHYWSLDRDATMRDVILAIRADEAHHRVVNHTLGSLKKTDYNPYKPGE